jgi:hypothetical protein
MPASPMNEIRMYGHFQPLRDVYSGMACNCSTNRATLTSRYSMCSFQRTNSTSKIARSNRDSSLKIYILSPFNEYGVISSCILQSGLRISIYI